MSLLSLKVFFPTLTTDSVMSAAPADTLDLDQPADTLDLDQIQLKTQISCSLPDFLTANNLSPGETILQSLFPCTATRVFTVTYLP